ncbi:MAG: hypothetical protein R3326_04385 [Gemmatimonadota bacterium]|nr:hypothetical protein [Gemmatimonadota bacterium]
MQGRPPLPRPGRPGGRRGGDRRGALARHSPGVRLSEPRIVAVLALAATLTASSAAAQGPTRPWADWRTLETEHLDVHYPAELSDWSLHTAARLESIHEAVTAFVGYEPEERVTVIVDDPANVSNGTAWPGPVVLLYPTPPDPASMIATHRGWSELLAVHELAHVAHFARPSRNPRDRWLRRLLPVPVGPILTRAPRWALEGYATLVEGRLTGSGRPHGAWRPAVLRTWALDGALPDYHELDAVEGFMAAAMAYLAGSAYLEWLVEDRPEESLPKVWRRLSARRERGFDEAFAGVFAGPPAQRYGEFTVEVTERALAVEDAVEAAGVARGEWIQRLTGWSADPAVSPDGERLAIVRRPAWDEPPEVVVWSTAEDTLTSEEREARERALERDPEDVAAVEWRPRPREALARLGPVGLRGHVAPRWLPDGESLLVVRWEGLGDGRFRPDVFVWRWREDGLRRVTRGAAIREADPHPDGRTAVGIRCPDGACDLVRIDLSSGAVTTLADGRPGERSYHGARVGPDGRIVASVFEGGAWRLALLDPDAREVRALAPAGEPTRFDAEWAGPDAVVAVSEAGGIHDLERIDVGTGGSTRLTRVVTAALAPAPAPDGSAFFLHLTSRGLDVRRVDGTAVEGESVAVDPGLAPAAAVPPVEAPALPAAELAPALPYGVGPRSTTWLPAGYAAPEGWALGGTLHRVDPIGRFAWQADGRIGGESAWRGGAVTAGWHGWRPRIRGQGFWARHEPSAQDLDGPEPIGLDQELAGGLLEAVARWSHGSSRRSARIGGTLARLDAGPIDGATRALGYVELAGAWLQTKGEWRIVERARLHGAVGETRGEGWSRGVVELAVSVGGEERRRAGVALYSPTAAGAAGAGAFALGGVVSPIVDPAVISQRIPDPALPVGWSVGERAASIRLAWRSDGGETYYRWTSAGESIGSWKRVVGSEASWSQPPVAFLGLPAIDLTLGVARLLDPPLEGETRLYGSVRYRP